ncbi:hypothetical protein [Pseudomonas sp. TE21394]
MAFSPTVHRATVLEGGANILEDFCPPDHGGRTSINLADSGLILAASQAESRFQGNSLGIHLRLCVTRRDDLRQIKEIKKNRRNTAGSTWERIANCHNQA